MAKVLDSQAIAGALSVLDGWELDDATLRRELVFDSFAAALGFMVQAGIEFDKIDHHPDWHNTYNKVTIRFVTHSAGGITELDLTAARFVNRIAP